MEKIHLYEYIDIIDPRNKIAEIEKIAKKKDKYSWTVLIEEIKEKVIMNKYIGYFIEKIQKNIYFSDIYYNTINKYIDEKMDEINDENTDFLFELQKYTLLLSIDDPKFYLFQKDKIYKELDIINKINIKLKNNENNNKLEDLKSDYIKKFEKRKGIIKLINNKTFLYNYDVNFIVNIKDCDDIHIYADTIKNNTIIYENVKLPKTIKIKEKNRSLMVLNIDLNINKDYYVIYNYFKYNNNNDDSDKKVSGWKYNSNIVRTSILYINKVKISNQYINKVIGLLKIIKINKKNNYIYYFDKWKKKHKT